jgi:hypothetical protein
MEHPAVAGYPTLGLVSRRALLAQGLSDDQVRGLVRRGALRRVRPGVYAADVGAPPHLVALGAVQLSAPSAVASHRSATHVYGLPLARPWERPELTRPDRYSHLIGTLTHRYRLDPCDVTVVDALSVTSVARTLVDVARVVPLAEALVPMDAALRREMVTRGECTAVIDRLPGVNYRWRARAMVRLGDPLSESPLESFSRGQLVEAGIPRPVLQVRLGDASGTAFFADMFWPEWGIVGECDGRVKYEGPAAAPDALWREKRRQEWMEAHGLTVLRWGWREVDRAPKRLAARWRAKAAGRDGWRASWPLQVGASRSAA